MSYAKKLNKNCYICESSVVSVSKGTVPLCENKV